MFLIKRSLNSSEYRNIDCFLQRFASIILQRKKMALKWGIIGTGKISNDFVNALNYLPKEEHQIIGVAASKLERAEEFALKHNIPIPFKSYEELAKDESIEVVYVGTNNASHYSLCKMVLSNKKHLLCEKPLCLKYQETKELILMAEENRLFLMEGVWSRFFPVYEDFKSLLESKAIGDILYLKANFGVPIVFNDARRKELFEGTIFDFGPYVLQLAILVFGRDPYSVAAVGHINDYGVDESINYILKYYDGRTASFCTHSKVRLDNSAIIYGTNGRIKIKDPFWAPTVICMNDGDDVRYPLPVIEGEQYYTHSQGLVYEAVEVRNCIKQGLWESPKMTHLETLTIAKWQEQICKLIGSKY